MQKLRKSLIVSVMMMTVFSMSMVVVPQVEAASAGDLIKMDGLSSVYYLGADNKRYVFPNEATYFSWYRDFNDVMVVPQSELETYPLAANVTIRPGTKLVTSPSNSLVYAVEPDGNLRSLVSEENAINLYGEDWASRVVDVIDAFFTNYTVGDPLTVGDYPTGSLVKTADSPDVYYIDENGEARKFADEAAFSANRFTFDDVLVASELPDLGADITGEETSLTDTSSGAGGVPNAGTGLTVSLAGDTAPSRNVPSGATLVPFATYNFTASSDGDVIVNSLTFTRAGAGDPADFDGGYLYVGGERLSNKRSVNTSDNTITFTALNLSVPAGMTKAVTLKLNADTGNLSGNHYFTIESASHVSTNGATVSGSFPLEGNTMSYSAVDAGAVTLTGQTNTPTYKIGESGVTFSEFTIAETSGSEKVYIHRIRLKQNQTVTDGGISDLSLELDDNIVAEGVSMVDKYVDFVLDTPYELGKSKTITAIIRGDVVDDIGKYLELYVKNTADIEITGNAYGDFYGVSISNSFTTTEADTCYFQGSEINVSFDGPAAAETKDDVDDMVLANFKINTSNQDVNFETLTVSLSQAGTSNGNTYNLTNLEMVDSDNNVAYSVADPTASGTQSLAFENVYIQKGVQYNFEIRGDVPDGATAGITYAASINFSTGQTARYQDADETLVVTADYSASSLSGKTMTVAAPAVSFSKVTTNDTSVVKDAKGVMLYKGKITANSVDDLEVTRVRFDASSTASNLSTDWDRLYLYKLNVDSNGDLDGTETLLDEETSLDQTYVSFSSFDEDLTVSKGASNGVYVVVRGDVKSSPTGNVTTVGWNKTSTNYNVKDSDNNAVASGSYTIAETISHSTTVTTLGTYTLAVDTELADLNNNKNVLAGEESLVGRLKLTASKEAAILEDLVIENAGTATNATLGRLYLYDNAELSGTPLGSADMGSNKKALFADVNIEVPTTGSTYLYIGGMVKGIDYSGDPSVDATGVAATTIQLKVPADATGYTTKAVGADTGDTLLNSSVTHNTTNTSTVMGAVISALSTDFVDATLVNGTAKDIFSFKVTVPDSDNINYDSEPLAVKLGTTTFTIATSAGVMVDTLKVERVGGANSEKTAIATPVTNTSFDIGFQNTYGTLADLKIKPGETAEFVVRGTIEGVTTSDSLQVTIESAFDGNLDYFHNTTDATTYTSMVQPLISGVSHVRGGTLSN